MNTLLPELGSKLGDVAGQTYAQLLRRPEVTLEALLPALEQNLVGSEDLAFFLPPQTARVRNELKSVETEIKYAGYLDRQRKAIDRMKKAEGRVIPPGFEYKGLSGLSREVEEKLTRVRPQTLGQASRIPGITPAAVSLLNVYLEIAGKRHPLPPAASS